MRQQQFEAQRGDAWRRVEALLDGLERGQGEGAAEFPALYRALCQDLALARDRKLSRGLIDSLNRLAVRGHAVLYSERAVRPGGLRTAIARTFPRAVRAEWRIVLALHVLFYGGLLLAGWIGYDQPAVVYGAFDAATVEQYESMYDPEREALDLAGRPEMFGFYILNNISIAFRMFAKGLLLAVGTLHDLTYNALFAGLVAGHLTRVGSSQPFYTFVIAHGAFELTAIVLAAAAGVRMGLAVLSPGPRSRRQALRDASVRAFPVVTGAGGLLLLAAAVEAFWSPLALAPWIKYAVGAASWLCVLVYLTAAGRRGAA